MNPALIGAGAITGLLVGVTGVGGGALMTPILVLLFGVAPPSAIGTDLWFAGITKVFAARVHHGHGLIDWPVVKRLWAGSLSSSALLLLLLTFIPVDQRTVSFFRTAIGAAVLLTVAGLLFQDRLHGIGRRLRIENKTQFKRIQPLLTVLAGVVLGTLVTLTSVGAGSIGVVILRFLYPLRLTPARLIATDLAHAIPLAILAGMGHLLVGNVHFGMLANMLVGSIPATVVGARLSAHLPSRVLRLTLAVVLFSVAVKLLYRTGP